MWTESEASQPKIHEVPFDAVTKRMITVHRAGNGRCFVAMKGAPAVVLDASTDYTAGNSTSLWILMRGRASWR